MIAPNSQWIEAPAAIRAILKTGAVAPAMPPAMEQVA